MSDKAKIKRFLYEYPKIASEWHPYKNEMATPNLTRKASHKKVWWQCSKDDEHQWEVSVKGRTSKESGCPFCSGRRATSLNNFAVLYPDKLRFWDYEKNYNLSPYDFLPRSTKKVQWVCEIGHSWEMSFDHMFKLIGCPTCANKRVADDNSLNFKFPKIAGEWHPFNNGDLTPSEIVHGYSKVVWWKCKYGHEWQTTPSSRTLNDSGCPKCSIQTSAQEIRIYTELLYIFDNVIQRHKINKIEVDIFIPKYNICIEYDGSYFHKDKVIKDKNKNIKLQNLGFDLIRVREGLSKISNRDIITKNVEISKADIDALLYKLIVDAGDTKNIDSYISKSEFQGGSEYNKILSYLPSPPPENSLEKLNKGVSKEWHYKNNYPLLPRNFKLGSNKKVWWQCLKNKNHEWQARISKRTGDDKTGCPYCSNKLIGHGNDLLTNYPEVAKQWHPEKNEGLLPSQLSPGSHQKVFWICENGHEWKAQIGSRTGGGYGCAKCNNKLNGAKITIVNGISYKSIAEAERAYDLKPGTVKNRKNLGWSDKRIFDLSK